jgi:ABC-2 type transport system permease protein
MSNAPQPVPAWRIVAEREISTKVRARSFQISLLVMVFAIAALIVLFSVLGDRPSDDTVAVIDEPAAQIVTGASTIAADVQAGSSITSKQFPSAEAAEQAVRDGEVDAALLPARDPSSGTYDVVGDSDIGSSLSQHLSSAASAAVLESNAAAADVDLDELRAGTQTEERLLDPDASASDQRQVAGVVFVILFYITAITFGMTIAQSVVQEKESRVVEILVAAIPVRALLWGKVVGTTILAMGQIIVLSAVAVAGLAVAGKTELLSLVAPAVGWGVVFFALGFVALAGLWAVAGSVASRTEDLQSTTMPGQILLFVPYLLAVTGGEAVKTVVSMVPIGSAMMMPVRLAEGAVPGWQLAVAVAGNLVAIVVLVRLAARIYQRTLMKTERKISYKEAFTLAE